VNPQNIPRKKLIFIVVFLVIVGIVLSGSSHSFAVHIPSQAAVRPTPLPSPTPTPTPSPTPTATPSPTPVPTLPVVHNTKQILGVEGDPTITYRRVPWVRLGYPTCGWGNLTGSKLKNTIDQYHMRGTRVLLTFCQGTNNPSRLYNINQLKDAAQGGPDAVQCGNEEMKVDGSVAFLYTTPENFARFFDQCERTMHAVRSDIPVLLGSLDPHVGGIDYQPLYNQVAYLNQMQYAMNTVVHPGGNWDWHTQALGLIDSWHNGYPDASVNSLAGLFSFWAQQFGVDLNSGALGKHLWVVEGTGCFKGCGVDPYNGYQVAVSHILALITDVQTSMRYSIPFFYFSGKDFMDAGFYWPIGVLDINSHPKPIRQDLPPKSRIMDMTCYPANDVVAVTDQEDLLGRLYTNCVLPDNYPGVIWS
jgi:hypothetical protein